MDGRKRRTGSIAAVLVTAGFAVWNSALCRADRIELTGGGVLRGEIQKPADGSETQPVTIRTLSGAVVSVDRSSIRETTLRPVILEEHEVRAAETEDSIEALWPLAEWCRENGLKSQRETHLRRIVELAPDHEKAHLGLGHVRLDGRWATRESIMEARGYVRHRGRFVTPQEQQLLQQKESADSAEGEWLKNIRRWKSWIVGRSEESQRAALAALQSIRDPAAIKALKRNFSDDKDPRLRGLYIEILSRIPGEQAALALIHQGLFESDNTLSQKALSGVAPAMHDLALQQYVLALRNESNLIVCRAAAALEALGDARAVPALIDALVTAHRYKVTVEDNSDTYAFSKNGGFANPNQFTLPPEIEIQLRTGQLNGAIVIPAYTGRKRTRVVTVERAHQNAPVHSALTALTGQSLGYDKRTWGKWWALHQQTVPQASGSL